MHERTRFIGLDVHKASIAVAVAGAFGDPEDHGQIANDPSAVRKLVDRLRGPDARLAVAYEAGPTGYALHRQLTALGVECVVVAPSLVPTKPGDRIKTDRRDAAKLARLLRSGDLTPVWVPDEAHEALRDLVRDRDDAKEDLLRAKHRLSKFLLRRGIHPPTGVRAWSLAHESWLNKLTFTHRADQVVFEDYWSVVRDARDRLKRLEVALVGCAAESPHAELLAALTALRGIGFLSAVTIVAEAGDLRRFPTARQFMAYVGLVPSEYSSGTSRHRPNVSSSLRTRQSKVPRAVVELDRRAQVRLHQRYRHLVGRIGVNKAVIAVARELAGFIWALGRLVESPAVA